jgi:Zn-dependent protease/predicted transcriptional regulator
MSWSIRLFRIKGIDVRVHLTFVLILIWAAIRWGVSMKGGTIGALYGVLVILLLFVCVTIHELSHSLTAMRFGVKVHNITLLPIGGIAQMEEMPKKPSEELRMSLAGPLSNFIIAAILLLLSLPFNFQAEISAGRMSQVLGSVSWEGLLAYLITANIMLGVFNLLPAFPMDGGRVLRSLLAMRMDPAKATSVAAAAGQGLAWVMGLFGVLSGAWTLVIIAVFIYLGAGQEGRMIEVKNVLGEMRVRQAMTTKCQVLSPDDPLSKAVDLILHGFQTVFPVLAEDGRLAGILTEADLVNALKQHGPEVAVKMAMRADVPTVGPDSSLFDAQQLISQKRLGALPVLKDGRIIGLLTPHDVSEAYLFLSLRPDLLAKT